MAERNPYSAPALGLVSTFYSYKGGVGRTFALANIAVLLARWGHRVLCVDWDLEAPGLPLYFQLTVRQKINQLPGVVEMIQAFESGEFHPGEEYVSSVTLPDTPPFDLIVAGRQDAN